MLYSMKQCLRCGGLKGYHQDHECDQDEVERRHKLRQRRIYKLKRECLDLLNDVSDNSLKDVSTSNIVIEEIDTRKAHQSDLDRLVSTAQKMGDLAFAHKFDISGCNPYACTFTYNPYSKFSITDIYDQYVQYDETIILKDPKKLIRTRQFGYFTFTDQYRIFVKHFKRWVTGMNKILDKKDQLRGWEVYIEKTKIGTLHAHAILWSNCNYDQAFGNYSATIWAQIGKGQVRAMNGAFGKVSSMESWNKYIIKDTELSLF